MAKVIFLHLSVILFTGGCLPQCMLGYHTPPEQTLPLEQTPHWEQTSPTSRHTSPQSRHTPKSRHPLEQTPLEQTPSNSRPPRADTPQEQTTPPQGPHPRGKLRGIRSRPTPKGEIEGNQIQAHTQGGN